MRISDWSSDVCSSDLGRDYRVLRCYPAACPCGHEASGGLRSRCDAAGGGTALRTGARAGARIDGDRIARCPTRPPHALSTWREADARPGPCRLTGGFGDEREERMRAATGKGGTVEVDKGGSGNIT